MIAIVKGKEIVCPICGNKDFDVKEVEIQAVKESNFRRELYTISRDELTCYDCGWTAYFKNEFDSEADFEKKKIQYEGF